MTERNVRKSDQYLIPYKKEETLAGMYDWLQHKI
jgi:hypothetical protein